MKHECGAAMRMEVAGDRLEESVTYTCEWNGTWTPQPGNLPPKCKCETEIMKVNRKFCCPIVLYLQTLLAHQLRSYHHHLI